MKLIQDNDTIQIEITNVCPNRCSNCTRFTGIAQPYMMKFDMIKKSIDSLIDFPDMIGFMGGEPLLHPEFKKFCEYALDNIPRERLGLWTCLPVGYEHYRELIVKTFGNIFINDHSRNDIYHHPFLVASKDVLLEKDMFIRIDNCYFQKAWSAAINPKGAFFCEMAASISYLYDIKIGWDIEKNWWKKTNKDYKEQIEEICPLCGGCLFLKRNISTKNNKQDISISNYNKFKELNLLIDRCNFYENIYEIAEQEQECLASYKDQNYRNQIASRYNIFLTLNEKFFNEPNLIKNINDIQDSIFNKYKSIYYK